MGINLKISMLFLVVRAVISAAWLIDSEGNLLASDNVYGLPEYAQGELYDTSSEELYDDQFADDDYEKNEETEIEDEETPYLKIPGDVPLVRVRRRIIPRVTGKTTLDTDRGNRDPWDRDRSPWQTSSANAGGLKRTGPMGSEKLYALYPHLAPQGRRGNKPRKIKKLKEAIEKKDQEDMMAEQRESQQSRGDVEVMDEGYGSRQAKTPIVNKKRREKPKTRMPKAIKEQIAEYALLYGEAEALRHFEQLLGKRIRPGAVEKYVQRHQARMERRRQREEERLY